jgi:hypothetical protein
VLYAPGSFARADAETSMHKLKQRWQRLAAMAPAATPENQDPLLNEDEHSGHSGHSDSDDEKENNRRLQWDFEVNADVDGTPCFGKAKMENRLW